MSVLSVLKVMCLKLQFQNGNQFAVMQTNMCLCQDKQIQIHAQGMDINIGNVIFSICCQCIYHVDSVN